jgi:hypothetical protein
MNPSRPPGVPEVFKECSNCRQNVPAGNLAVHEAHCYRHVARCDACGVLLPRAELDAHVAERVGALPVLLAALDAGDVDRLHSALAHGGAAVAGQKTAEGKSLVHLVAERAGGALSEHGGAVLALVRALLTAGADACAADAVGLTPLHTAARAGAAGVVQLLLDAGADAEAASRMGSTPLSVACGEDVRLLLLGAGAAVRAGARTGVAACGCGRGGNLPAEASASMVVEERRRGGSFGGGLGGADRWAPVPPNDEAQLPVNGVSPRSRGRSVSSGEACRPGASSAAPRPRPASAARRPSSSRAGQRLRAAVSDGQEYAAQLGAVG